MLDEELKAEKVKHPNGRRWSDVAKREAVDSIESGRLTVAEVMEKHGIKSWNTLNKWRFEAGKPKAVRVGLSESAKRRIAHEVHSGLATVEEVMAGYGIRDRKTVRRWVAVYTTAPDISASMEIEAGTRPDAGVEGAADEVAALRRQLEEQVLRVLALETIIEVAEEELGVEIRKKSGAKLPGESGRDTRTSA